MFYFKSLLLLILTFVLIACATSSAKLDDKLIDELVNKDTLPYPTKYLFSSKKAYDEGRQKYGRDAYKDITKLINEMFEQKQVAMANAYLELLKEIRYYSGVPANIGAFYPHVALQKKSDHLAVQLELESALKFARAGDIATTEQIVNWCCKLSESKAETHPHHKQVKEVLKALAPHVARAFRANPEPWKSDEKIKHMTQYYAPYFYPNERKAVETLFMEWATNDIRLINEYLSKHQYRLAVKKVEYLEDIYANFISLESDMSLPVINARARKYHELLASRPGISDWTKLAHERIAWYFFKSDYVPLPEYKVHGENKLKTKIVSELNDYCFPDKNRDWKYYLLDNKDAEVTIDLFDCKFAGQRAGYQKRGMVTKTRWKTYEEKVPIYESITTYEEHKTSSYKIDMGQTTKCLTTKNNRCTSSYRTTADPVVVPASTYLIPKTKKTLVGYKTVTRRQAINYQEPGIIYRSGANWSAITGKVHMTYQGEYRYKDIHVDKDYIVKEINSAFIELANKFDLKASVHFDHQNAYDYRYNELQEILSETKDLSQRESLTAQLMYLYSLLDSKPILKSKSNNIFKDQYGIGLEMADALNPSMKQPESSNIKDTQLLYDKSTEKYTPHIGNATVVIPRSYYLMEMIDENRIFWKVCRGESYWPPRKNVGKADGKLCYNKSPKYWDKRAKERRNRMKLN